MRYNIDMGFPDFIEINARFIAFSSLPARDHEGNRPAYCPECKRNRLVFAVFSLAGGSTVDCATPRYLGDGRWICGFCDHEFVWEKTPVDQPTDLIDDLRALNWSTAKERRR